MRSVGNIIGGFGLAALIGCGGTVEGGPTAVSAAAGGAAGTGGHAGVLEDGGPAAGGTVSLPEGGPDVPYRDPGCPPETVVQGVHECDVGASFTNCLPGDRCVPYITYGERCRTEEIGTRCTTAGTAAQGDDCVAEPCADGYVCVSAGSGFECAQLCTVQGGKSDCPPGLLCSPLDVDGYSVCG